MMHVSARATLLCLAFCVLPRVAATQPIQDWDCKQGTFERIDADRIRLMREAECNGSGPNAGQQIFADEVIWNVTTGELEANGNVLIVSPTARLSAERAVFNTKTKLGTFYTASGLASLGERGVKDKSMFGTLEPDIYFHGETIEKTGRDQYVVSNGAFTTCVQPTPRWNVVSGKATINLDDYAILSNAVMRVKDVPIFYLPILYYPIQSDDRATGFLLPTYGRSSYRGQSLSNAFFWAINRSQDLTLYHDWYTKTGQGAGAEYRYAAAPGAQGFIESYWLKEKETVGSDDGLAGTPGRRSYEVRGEVAQPLPAGMRGSARVDYFSDLTTQQLYNTNIYEASRRQRTIAASVSGAWSGVSMAGNFRRSELFNTETESIVNGYAPSFTANLSSRRLGTLPLYVAFNGEASRILYLDRRNGTETDTSLSRFDATPTLRAALTTWPFLNVNGTVAYRHTYFTESLDEARRQVPVPFTRRYYDMRADIVGPIFSRVFTPNNALADRLKHIVEPNVSFQRITSYEGQNRVPFNAGSYDFIVGGVTRINYGLTNRVMVRKTPKEAPAAAAAAGAPRELLSVGVTQSYYTDPLASQFDLSYQSSYGQIRPPSSFSPVAVTMRAAPTPFSTGTVRLEYDTKIGRLEGFNAVGSTTYRAAQTSIGWSTFRRDLNTLDNALNAATTINLAGGRTGGSYFMDWDIGRGYIIQQRWIGFYSAQCCGFAVEYQEFNFRVVDPRIPVPQDRRFNLSFTLAGIGTFSNFFGAFGGSRY